MISDGAPDPVGPRRTSTPVSSATSRTAAVVACSPGSSFPLGNDQSSYLGRWTSSTRLPVWKTTTPAASTSLWGMALVSHHLDPGQEPACRNVS